LETFEDWRNCLHANISAMRSRPWDWLSPPVSTDIAAATIFWCFF